jgi:hypothetical protein
VTWVLWNTGDRALVLIPEEADLLLPMLRSSASREPVAHLLAYSSPTTRRMNSYFHQLDYFAIPPLPEGWKAPYWLKVELGILGGRLYFDYSEYANILSYFALLEPRPVDVDVCDRNDPADDEEVAERVGESATEAFAKYPVQFMNDWLVC